MQKKHISIEINVVHLTFVCWKRRFLREFQGFKLSKNEKKIECLKIETWAALLIELDKELFDTNKYYQLYTFL